MNPHAGQQYSDDVLRAARAALRDAAVEHLKNDLPRRQFALRPLLGHAALALYLNGDLGKVEGPTARDRLGSGPWRDICESFADRVGAENLVLVEEQQDHAERPYSRMTKADKARSDARDLVQGAAVAFLGIETLIRFPVGFKAALASLLPGTGSED